MSNRKSEERQGLSSNKTNTRSKGQLTLEVAMSGNKKVIFKDTELKAMAEEIDTMKKPNKRIKDNFEKQAKAWEKERKDWEEKMREQKSELIGQSEKLEKLEEKVESLESVVKKLEEWLTEALRLPTEDDPESQAEGASGGDTAGGARGSTWSLRGGVSRRTYRSERSGATSRATSVNSWMSGYSEGFSGREVSLMKKMLYDKDRVERANNVVFEGATDLLNDRTSGADDIKGWVENLIKSKLAVEVKIAGARIVGGREKVVIVKLESEEDKRKIMTNKNKLKGTRIYIEHDLNFEDRKKQEEIKRWAYDRKVKGWNVKIGIGRVGINNQWIKWEDEERLRKIEYDELSSEYTERREVYKGKAQEDGGEDEEEKNEEEN